MPQSPDPNLPTPAIAAPDAHFRMLIDGVHSYAIILLDPAGRIVHWNAGATQIFGFDASEVIGRTMHVLYAPADVNLGLPEAAFSLLQEQGHCEEEGWRIRKDGSRFWSSIVLNALRDDDTGEIRGYSAILCELTTRKRAEWLERDSRQVLELVARNEPLARVLSRLGETIER